MILYTLIQENKIFIMKNRFFIFSSNLTIVCIVENSYNNLIRKCKHKIKRDDSYLIYSYQVSKYERCIIHKDPSDLCHVKGQSITNVAARYFIKKSQSSKDKSETFCSCPNHCRKSLNVTCNTNNNSYNTYKFS
jgi:hypothetical protein